MTPKLTSGELEILQVLWEKGEATVREVHEVLNKNKPVVYTTMLKFMQVMTEKGLLTREESGKAHIYKAAISQTDTQQHLLEKMIKGLFGGSVTNLVMQALGNHTTSQEEVDSIKEYLENLKKEK